MIIVLVIIVCLGALVAAATVVGITLHDIHSIRLDKEFRLHPYAGRFRKRPLVSILIDGKPSRACLAGIRKSNYRKVEIVKAGDFIRGELLLTLAPNTVLDRTAISHAVRQLNGDLRKQSVEIRPMLESPNTVRAFLNAYYRIAVAPFIDSRAGLNIITSRSVWPNLSRLDIAALGPRDRLYACVGWLATVANLFTLLLAAYLAVTFYQPEYLLMYFALFGCWLLWAISRYHHLRFKQKIAYVVLAPASLIYFFVRSLAAPFTFRKVLS